jgi:hypothetical protein
LSASPRRDSICSTEVAENAVDFIETSSSLGINSEDSLSVTIWEFALSLREKFYGGKRRVTPKGIREIPLGGFTLAFSGRPTS